jgi:colanic acid/amylovoran biosynthesis glycosyltransferase
MPADENQEGIPNSILEAMATGMPVLATRHGGIPEAVEEGRCGALVEERDHEALAAEMSKITRTPYSFSEMGVLASEFVAANFEQRLHIAALEANYRDAKEIAEEAEARVGSTSPVLAPPFQQESVPAK